MSVTVTTAQLQKICRTEAGKAAANTYTTVINMAMANWGINNPLRAAMFIAQVIYETAEFQSFAEAGSDLYRGRGAFRIAGADQYKALGKSLAQDLLTHPEYLVLPSFAFEAAGWVWTRDGQNDFAEGGDIVGSTRLLEEMRVNYKGTDVVARQTYYDEAIDALDADVVQHPLDGDPVASDTGASTTDGYLRWLRDWFYTNFGSRNDVVAINDDGAWSLFSLLKRITYSLSGVLSAFSNRSSSATLYSVGQELIVPIGDCGALGIQIRGNNAGGVISFAGCQDGSDFIPINAIPISAGGDNNPTSTASTAGNFAIIGGGLSHIRIRLTQAGTGSFSVVALKTPAIRNIGVPALGSALDSAAGSDTGSANLIQLFKRLLLKTPAVASNTFTLNAAGQDCQVPVSEGHQTVSISIAAGTINGTLNLQYSNDNGASWFNLISQLLNTSATPTPSITATGSSWDAPIPADATHVRLYANTINSGSATGKIIVSARPFPAPQSVWAGLTAGSSRVGSVYAAEVHYQDTTTALTTGATTFSATIRDCKNAGSGAVAGAASYAKTYSVIACGDKSFDLFVYVSENGSTLYKAYKQSAVQVDSGLYVAEITITPKMRWAQAQATLTGGVSMTQFTMATSMVAN